MPKGQRWLIFGQLACAHLSLASRLTLTDVNLPQKVSVWAQRYRGGDPAHMEAAG